jgi:hypothetical protein
VLFYLSACKKSARILKSDLFYPSFFILTFCSKRTDNQDKVFDASAYFRQQQEQQEQLQALKEQQRQLHLEQQQLQNGGGSSQAPTGAVPVAAAALP